MEQKITEEGILEVKALTMTRGMFNQVLIVTQKQYEEYQDLTGKDPYEPASWVGYVVDGTMQFYSFIFQHEGTLQKIRDNDLFFVMGGKPKDDPVLTLKKQLKQIFLK